MSSFSALAEPTGNAISASATTSAGRRAASAERDRARFTSATPRRASGRIGPPRTDAVGQLGRVPWGLLEALAP